MQQESWEAFVARMKRVYWPSMPPSMRSEERPDAPADDPEVPGDIWAAAVAVFPDAEAWLNNPIPQAKGSSPLELIGRGESDRVRQIIMQVSSVFLPDAAELAPWSEAEAAVAEAEARDEEDAEKA